MTRYGDSPFMDMSPQEFAHTHLIPKKFFQRENIPEDVLKNVWKFNFTEKADLTKDSRLPGNLKWVKKKRKDYKEYKEIKR